MKFSIEGFSQEKLLEQKLDFRDALFLRWFADFQQTDQMKVLVEHEVTYFWLKHSYVAEQIPILGLSSETGVRHYLKRLVDSGVLHRLTRADAEGRGSRAFYCIDSGVWRSLTEKIDQRPTQDGGQPDQRPAQDGGQVDQRPTQDGDRDDQRPVQDGGQLDQRPTQDAQILPSSSDSSNRRRDARTTRVREGAPPPPKESDEKDPIDRLTEYIRHHVAGFIGVDQTTEMHIRQFVRVCGVQALEKATRAYVHEKDAKRINRYFAGDFCERLSDIMRRTHPREPMEVCSDCKATRPTSLAIDWDGRRICTDCARKAKEARIDQQRVAS